MNDVTKNWTSRSNSYICLYESTCLCVMYIDFSVGDYTMLG